MSGVTFRAHSPVLLVHDVVKAHAYYTEQLGFSGARMFGDPPTFCIVRRDELELMLNQVGAGDSFRPNGDYDGRADAYFWVSDADALHAEFQAAGAKIVCEPEDQPYGMRDLQVTDPDGHLLIFGHDISGTIER